MRRFRVIIGAGLLVIGVVGGAVGVGPARAENWPTSAGSYDLSYVTPWDGRTREYRLHLPTGFAPGDGVYRPLVVVMHGYLGSSSSIESGTEYSLKADAENFIVVYPQGTGSSWNASTNCCGYAKNNNVDDVRFITDLVSRLSGVYTIDAAKVFAAGMSNGGVMSWRLACDAPGVFAAIGPNAADSTSLHPDGSPCNLNGDTVRVVNLHGDADNTNPYMGGPGLGGYDREPVEDPNPNLFGGQTDIGQWTALNGCTFTPVSTQTTADYVKKAFCTAPGVEVVNYKVLGGTHQWFTVANDGISTTDTTWAFFENVTTLFADGFESGNFTAGGWTTTGSPLVSTAAANAGTYGARVRATASITKQVSTVGHTSISVSYARRTSGLDAGEFLYAEWSTDGLSWTNIAAPTQDTSWGSVSVTLPAGANGQSGFRIRFRTNASSTTERGDVDSVSVSAA